jgi:hypothetical protein
MTDYKCPLCGREMSRNLAVYLDHTQQHVIDQIKKEHPEWVAEDGACKPCAEYYKIQLSGKSGLQNIGPRGRRIRLVLGFSALALGFGWIAITQAAQNSATSPFVLFPFFFAGLFGLIQARQRTCAILAEKGVRDMDFGEGKIPNAEVVCLLKKRGRKILVQSALGALLLTVLAAFLFS